MALKFPRIYLLKSHFERDLEQLHKLEKEIGVVYNIREAKLVLGRVSTKKRARLDLHDLELPTEEIVREDKSGNDWEGISEATQRQKKRRKVQNTEGKEVISVASSIESEQ